MDAVRRYSKPILRRPRAIIAFEGWNDACEAASGAAAYILGNYGVDEPFASIEPEEFFDFQEHRPTVHIDGGGTRQLSWPDTRFYAVSRPMASNDLIVVIGEEPSFRWKTFSRHITKVLSDCDVEEVVLLGAFIGDVAHTPPVPLAGVAVDPEIVPLWGLIPSTYEGPTGIVGVMLEACREAGLRAVSIWAATPHYLAANANPKTMLALVRKSVELLELDVDTRKLARVESEFSSRVDEAIASNGDLAEYIETIATEGPDDIDPSRSGLLLNEIEDYLKDQY
jgi:proteasome assembly chaperone (PAC2) family protein